MNRLSARGHRALLVWALAGLAVLLSAQSALAGLPYQSGDVFAGVGSGQIKEFHPDGSLYQTIDTTSNSNEDTGMCFNGAGNLYSTNFSAGNMTRFDNAANVLQFPWGGPFFNPESCAVDQSNNVFVGDASSNVIRKFTSTGTLLDVDTVDVDRGTDWIDLAADQCTVYYASEGSTVYRYNTCTNTQLAPFATGLQGSCFALRIRLNGEVLVACTSQVYRLDPSGGTIQTYSPAGSDFLFALNADPDGTSFWTGDIGDGDIFRIDIASGALIKTFNAAPSTTMAGLAVFGEQTVGGPAQGRMVGKGSGTDTLGHGFTYWANNDNCNPAQSSKNTFQVVWPSNTFKLTQTTDVACTDDPSISYDPPKADFDTQTGNGVGTVNGQSGWTIEWKETDQGAGSGDANDTTEFTIKNPGGTAVIHISGNPGPFPGSRQSIGQNTATSP